MSRWAEMFAALSGGTDTLDTMRHSGDTPSTVSQSVNSVTILPSSSEPSPATKHALAVWGDAEAERASLAEHDGNIPLEWAEGFVRLDPDRPPGDVPLRRWQRFVDDVGMFLDRWATYASALGWGPHDLFGCNRDRPFARIDQSGLLWLLNGAKLVALSEDAAGIETRTGERHAYRRKPNQPGSVLAWELER